MALNLDLHDASQGGQDSWIFYGDSVTLAGLDHSPRGVGTFAQLVAAGAPGYFPLQENGGLGYATSATGARYISAWVALFPGQFVALSYGLNDANNAPSGAVNAEAFYASYVAMVEAVLAAGKTPVVATIPWARASSVQANGPLLNARLAELYAAYPQIVRGPDLWSYFQANQHLISGDNLHPTAEGYAAYRQQWATHLLATVYSARPATTGLPVPSLAPEQPAGSADGRLVPTAWRAVAGASPGELPESVTQTYLQGVLVAPAKGVWRDSLAALCGARAHGLSLPGPACGR